MQEWMQYASEHVHDARRLFISSGMVESGCKQVVRHMKITGARWLHQGAQAIVQIRVALLNGEYCPASRLRLAACCSTRQATRKKTLRKIRGMDGWVSGER